MSNDDIGKKSHCFDFWYDLPSIIFLDDGKYSKNYKQFPRKQIMDALVSGISEIHPKLNELRVRRALSAKEILDIINYGKRPKDEFYLKKSNLYFHLQKLEDDSVIKVIEQIPTGKRFTTFYGRTAKIISPPIQSIKEEDMDDYNIFLDSEFKKLILTKNPNLDISELDSILNLAKNIKDRSAMEKLPDWLKEHESIIRDSDLDLRKLYELLDILIKYNDETVQALKKLRTLLGVEKFL
jgi:hypothetical protein